jgi:RNA polymerase sigma-70 factor (ECF subfamily)
MTDLSVSTIELRSLLDRMQAGDLSARDELLRRYAARLEQLTRRMLRGYARVHRWEDTSDVMQGATVRLIRALQSVRPSSTKEFLGLAATQIRRELLDLARRYYGPWGHGANIQSVGGAGDSPGVNTPDKRDAELEKWAAFHEAVEALPLKSAKSLA